MQHNITHAAMRFFSGTMLSRVTGLVRDISMAAVFGTSSAVASFFIAYRFAFLLRRLLGESNVHAAFVPLFQQRKQECTESSAQLFRDCMLSLILVLFAIVGLGCVVLLYYGTDVAFLTAVMLPCLLFVCLYSLNAGLLQCDNRYFIVGIAPAVFNLVWIAFIWGLQEKTVFFLAVGVVIASFFQWLITLPYVLPTLCKAKGKWRPFSDDVCLLFAPLSLGIIGIAAERVNAALDPLFASVFSASGPAFLFYANRLQQFPLALFAIAISGALLPPLCSAVQSGNQKLVDSLCASAISQLLFLLIPSTAALFIAGPHMICFLFARGSFTTTSIVGVSWATWGYSLGLLPAALVIVFAPLYFARGNYKTPSVCSCVSVGVNIVFNALFVFVFGWGASSVALATSMASAVNAFFLGRKVWELMQESTRKTLLQDGKKAVQVSLCAAVLSFSLMFFLELTPEKVLQGIWPDAFIVQLAVLLAVLSPFVIAVLFLSKQALWLR